MQVTSVQIRVTSGEMQVTSHPYASDLEINTKELHMEILTSVLLFLLCFSVLCLVLLLARYAEFIGLIPFSVTCGIALIVMALIAISRWGEFFPPDVWIRSQICASDNDKSECVQIIGGNQ